jgi:cation:H+ antiporter
MEISDSTFISIIYLAIGSVFLYFGAEGLVRGSSSIAFRFGIKPLVIGLTLVAFGTSSPELAVSLSAALEGNSGISAGNVIGSNICNIALIIGVAALIRPIEVEMKVIKTDISIMVGVTILSIILISDGIISFFDGVILTVGIIVYNVATIYFAKKNGVSEDYAHFVESRKKKYVDILLVVFGLAGILLGANVFLLGAQGIAIKLGASEALIGLTIVAFGTSLPELATSVVASIKDEGDISIGNAIGSNIFNLLCILGITALVVPIDTTGISAADLAIMLVVAILIIPMAFTKRRLSRIEGAILLFIYFLYVAYLYLTHYSVHGLFDVFFRQ